MKKFARMLTITEMRQRCAETGTVMDTMKFDQGSDYVTIYFKHGKRRIPVAYNTFNGTFITQHLGRTVTGASACDGEPWFDALLDFLYDPNLKAA